MARTTRCPGARSAQEAKAFFPRIVRSRLRPPLPVAFGHPDNKLSGPPRARSARFRADGRDIYRADIPPFFRAFRVFRGFSLRRRRSPQPDLATQAYSEKFEIGTTLCMLEDERQWRNLSSDRCPIAPASLGGIPLRGHCPGPVHTHAAPETSTLTPEAGLFFPEGRNLPRTPPFVRKAERDDKFHGKPGRICPATRLRLPRPNPPDGGRRVLSGARTGFVELSSCANPRGGTHSCGCGLSRPSCRFS